MKKNVLTEGVITKTQLKRLEDFLDKIFKQFDIDVDFQLKNMAKNTHFVDQINNPRNTEPITIDELRGIFVKTAEKYGEHLTKLGPKFQAVLKDFSTDINIPFILDWDFNKKEFILIPKTAMKKKNFHTPNRILAVNENSVTITKKEFLEIIKQNII